MPNASDLKLAEAKEVKASDTKGVSPLAPIRFALAEYTQNRFTANIEDGTPLEDVLRQDYWAHVGFNAQPLDRIEARHEFNAWIAELVVLSAGKNWIKVKLLQKYDLEAVDQSEGTRTSLHRVEHKGQQHKWSVIRNADNQIVQSGFTSKDQAQIWLRNHEAVTA